MNVYCFGRNNQGEAKWGSVSVRVCTYTGIYVYIHACMNISFFFKSQGG